MSVQDLNNNDFLLSLLAAVIQQTQQQQQQLQEQQQQVWSAAFAAAQSQLAAATAAAVVTGSPHYVPNASSSPCTPLGAAPIGAGGNHQHQQLQQQHQLLQQMQQQQQQQQQHHHQQPQFISNASSPCPLGANGQHIPPTMVGQCPSSSLLAKLNAVTSRPQANLPAHTLDNNMIDLLEALYAINDNPEMGAIEMISKRINVPCDLVADWFENKRMELNPFAGPRSPPCNKKREGGRVVTFSEYQRSLLEGIFNENNYLHPSEYEELSKLIQVPSRNIKIWFKNRRSKQRLSGGSQK